MIHENFNNEEFGRITISLIPSTAIRVALGPGLIQISMLEFRQLEAGQGIRIMITVPAKFLRRYHIAMTSYIGVSTYQTIYLA